MQIYQTIGCQTMFHKNTAQLLLDYVFDYVASSFLLKALSNFHKNHKTNCSCRFLNTAADFGQGSFAPMKDLRIPGKDLHVAAFESVSTRYFISHWEVKRVPPGQRNGAQRWFEDFTKNLQKISFCSCMAMPSVLRHHTRKIVIRDIDLCLHIPSLLGLSWPVRVHHSRLEKGIA